MIGKLFHYSQYNKHRKDLPAENIAVYIKVTVSLKTGKRSVKGSDHRKFATDKLKEIAESIGMTLSA